MGTVDGRNPAPGRRQFIPLFTGFYTSQVVQDFFHQQYFGSLHHLLSPQSYTVVRVTKFPTDWHSPASTASTWLQTIPSWWLKQPLWKNMRKSNWIMSPIFEVKLNKNMATMSQIGSFPPCSRWKYSKNIWNDLDTPPRLAAARKRRSSKAPKLSTNLGLGELFEVKW